MKKIRVALLYHSFCCKNLGVGALAISECVILQQICDKYGIELEIDCFEAQINDSYKGCIESKITLVETSLNPVKMLRRFRKYDLIIDVTAGDSFSDIYGAKIYYIIMYIKFLSIISGKKVILAPQTIGPFKKKFFKFLANFYLKYVDGIFLRDEKSRDALSIKNNKNIFITTDMAFKLPFEKGKVDINNKNKTKKAGLNISGLIYSGGYHLENKEENFYKNLIKKIVDLLYRFNFEVYIVPHVVGECDESKDNDIQVSIDICKEDKRLKLAPLFENPIEAKSFISGLDLFIGSRMHATIAAVSSGVPTIPLAYSRKFEGLYLAIGYNMTINLVKKDEKTIIDEIETCIIDYKIIKEQVNESKEVANKKIEVYIEYLEKQIYELAYE